LGKGTGLAARQGHGKAGKGAKVTRQLSGGRTTTNGGLSATESRWRQKKRVYVIKFNLGQETIALSEKKKKRDRRGGT